MEFILVYSGNSINFNKMKLICEQALKIIDDKEIKQ
jgi:hypothetical protein